MILYRIYTEDVNRDRIEQICLKELTGFTITTGTGHWNGHREKCVVIDILGQEQDRDAVQRVASSIKTANKQESVIVTETVLGHVWTIGKERDACTG